MANPEHVEIVRQGSEALNAWREKNPDVKLDLSDTNLSGTNLCNADLSEATLYGANFRYTNLHAASFEKSNLCEANFGNADLANAYFSGADLSFADFSFANLKKADFDSANLNFAILCNASLQEANLCFADLYKAKCSRADFRAANLMAARALETNFRNARFTGACIADWNINSQTNLDEVVCGYIFFGRENYQYSERRPSSGQFGPGDFAKLVQKSISTVDLIFRTGINWEAFAHSFQKLQVQTGSHKLDIQAIENKGDGDFVIRVNAPPSADKAKIQEFVMEEYRKKLKAIEAKYHAQLQAKDEQIRQYNQENTNLWEITKLLASKPLGPIDISLKKEKSMQLTDERRKILLTIALNEPNSKSSNEIATELGMDLNEVVYHMQELAKIDCLKYVDANNYHSNGKSIEAFITSKGVVAAKTPEKILKTDNSNVQIRNYDQRGARFNNGFIETNYGNQIGTQHNYAPEKQDLAEAAADIQNLLKQLEETNPTATEIEKQTFISMGIGATKKQRLINAVKSGGKAAIEEFLDNPYLNVAIAIIEGWKENEGSE